jgi:hypothetical protein
MSTLRVWLEVSAAGYREFEPIVAGICSIDPAAEAAIKLVDVKRA